MVSFLNAVVTVAKLQPNSDDADKEGFVNDAGLLGVKMNIQPASAEDTVLVDGAFGKTYTVFTTYSGIGIGDRITTSGGGRVYQVRGRKDWGQPPMPHYELTIVSNV